MQIEHRVSIAAKFSFHSQWRYLTEVHSFHSDQSYCKFVHSYLLHQSAAMPKSPFLYKRFHALLWHALLFLLVRSFPYSLRTNICTKHSRTTVQNVDQVLSNLLYPLQASLAYMQHHLQAEQAQQPHQGPIFYRRLQVTLKYHRYSQQHLLNYHIYVEHYVFHDLNAWQSPPN